MTRLLIAALAFSLAGGALAQLRFIPAEARAGKIRHMQEMIVQVDGKLARLAGGALVRVADNRLRVPTAFPPDGAVSYTLNPQGVLSAVWIGAAAVAGAAK
jgi:hypothetical protein